MGSRFGALAEEEYDKIAPVIACTLPALTDSIPERKRGACVCVCDARIAPPFMEATDASRLVCVVVVSYQEYSLTHSLQEISLCLLHFFRS